MDFFYWDASALGKRYAPEVGTETVNYLFDAAPHSRFFLLTQSIGEVLSIIVRKRNSDILTTTAYQQAAQALRAELILAGEVRLQTAADSLVFNSLVGIERYSINSTDALILSSALQVAATLGEAGHRLVLVAADVRLLRAAQAEGLSIVNPEIQDSAQIKAWFHSATANE